MKHVPLRTCVGCKSVIAKRELVRIVRTTEGIRIDPTGKLSGRGAYVHNLRSCWEQALRGPIQHALRVEFTAEDRETLARYMNQLPPGEPATTPSPIDHQQDKGD
ncbi:MAG TPA: YlxR family protein [Anaerolineaceae bacterium]|nr:YlxR family protein [Anaerolineaceae bacterium]